MSIVTRNNWKTSPCMHKTNWDTCPRHTEPILFPWRTNKGLVTVVTGTAWPPSHYHARNVSFKVHLQRSIEVEITRWRSGLNCGWARHSQQPACCWWHFAMNGEFCFFSSWTTEHQRMHNAIAQHCGTWRKQSRWSKRWALVSSGLESKKRYIAGRNVSVALAIRCTNRGSGSSVTRSVGHLVEMTNTSEIHPWMLHTQQPHKNDIRTLVCTYAYSVK
jgi:hypothetical protein